MGLLSSVLLTIFQVYYYALIVYILLSWLPGARDSAFGHFLARICEPYLEPFRRFIPPLGVIDISPIVAIIVLGFARDGLRRLLYMIS
ncbi:YggT family protein [Ectobacillus sp. JY-23]|uniref:YggT family protein n=1 Tax=Ectobacillus sp. JY-23 TaxID=2933872 RepID=UPI001FF2E964|nr:YggT family protein [Ectobacillus sp. JY-23]UOY93717.1 YggT family protein [Ectobacillus sp. JY-23]